jgi:hypothetical protein
MHIADILDLVAAEPSLNEKKRILRAGESPLLLKVLKAAMDPFVTYGVTREGLSSIFNDIHFNEDDQSGLEDARFWDFLGQLQRRDATGRAAMNRLLVNLDGVLTWKDYEVFVRILDKDLRCGIGATLINQVFPKLIPEFDVMLAKSSEDVDLANLFPLYIEPKYDGMRAIFRDGVFRSRNGMEIPSVRHLAPLADQLLQLAGLHVLDGEMITSTFNDSMSQLRKKDRLALDAKFMVFEALTAAEFSGECSLTHTERRARLDRIPFGHQNIAAAPTQLVHSQDEVRNFVNHIWAAGGEGAILKTRHAVYEPKRSSAWLKIKKQETIDAPIVSTFIGKGKYKSSLGGVTVEIDGVAVNVGSGFTDSDRAVLWADRDQLPGKIIEIEYHEKTPDGSLRHPRFVKFRPDKERHDATAGSLRATG